MTEFEQTPRYNLKAVSKETSLSPEILHAWERRYGLPNPQRSPGGHRLYSQYDIAILNWLKARQEEGVTISQAVKHWNDIVAHGKDPFSEYYSTEVLPVSGEGPSQVASLRQQWLDACLSYNEKTAEKVLNYSFGLYPVEMVCREFLQLGLRQIGEEWYRGKVSVQQEHFTSMLSVQRLEMIIASTPSPTLTSSIMVACPPGEWHTFPALMLTLLLRRRGYEVVYLGADVPHDHILDSVSRIQPQLVVLAAQRLSTAATLSRMAEILLPTHMPVGYGGLIFNRNPGLRQRMPAFFLGETIEESIDSVKKIDLENFTGYEIIEQSSSLISASQAYVRNRLLIDAELMGSSSLPFLSEERGKFINKEFGDNLAASLELGNWQALSAEIEWTKGLLEQNKIPLEWLADFLAKYQQAVQKIMGKEAGLVADWISRLD